MTEFCIKAYFKARNFFYDLTHKENGDTNIIAIILVLLIVVILAMIFKNNLMSLFNSIWDSISGALSGNDKTGALSPTFETAGGANPVGFIRPFLW